MKVLHQVGHNKKWNLDAHFENEIGNGFILGAFNLNENQINVLPQKVLDKSSIDLQFFGKIDSNELGKLNTYSFHPANRAVGDVTEIDGIANICNGIKFQEKLNLSNIIIPAYFEETDFRKLLFVINEVSEYLSTRKKAGHKYFMTVPISNTIIKNIDQVDLILAGLTSMNQCFDGYYIVCDSSPGYKQKVSTDFDYLNNLSKVFSVLKDSGFSTIYGYSNWDALIFLATTDIDYITIGTYENLRSFNNLRYSQKSGGGGPSDGWYFSEKLLNFIRAKEITNIRRNKCLPLIRNEENIFSDVILDEGFKWNTHKPEVHKNYLLSISRLLNEVALIPNPKTRIDFVLNLIDEARMVYAKMAKEHVFLVDESSDYFLGTWNSFLQTKKKLL